MPEILQDVDVPDPKDTNKTIKKLQDVHFAQTQQWIKDNNLEDLKELGPFQAAHDGCYECDEFGNCKRNPNKKVILDGDTLTELQAESLTKDQLEQLQATGRLEITKPVQIIPSSTGQKGMNDVRTQIEEMGLKVDFEKVMEFDSVLYEAELRGQQPIPLNLEHVEKTYLMEDDYMYHCPVEFVYHKTSEVTKKEIDVEFASHARDLGNSFTANQGLNTSPKKFCCFVVKHGKTMSAEQIDALAMEISRTS